MAVASPSMSQAEACVSPLFHEEEPGSKQEVASPTTSVLWLGPSPSCVDSAELSQGIV